MSKFQTILLVVFGAFILIAVMIFSFSRGSSGTASTVTIWGDIPASDWNTFSIAAGLTQAKDVSIFYEEKKDLIRDFTEALAEERGPDLIILSQAELWQERNRLLVIPYSSISERDFKSTFVEAGEL
ncbi:MAG: hypothetical protein Q8O98_01130, partial [bacterium]|nr:hypothetical protein [bacterium]